MSRVLRKSLSSPQIQPGRNGYTAFYRQLATSAAAQMDTVLFPRQRPGVNYALNWALVVKGVLAKGDVSHNLSDVELKRRGAITSDQISGQIRDYILYARGNYSTGAKDISKALFSKIFKEVAAHLSEAPQLYVHDGAIGSSPRLDLKVRTISDNPSAALALRGILCRTPIRVVSYMPLAVYSAPKFRAPSMDELGLPPEETEYMIMDYDRLQLILGGHTFLNPLKVKSALMALSTAKIMSRAALPLAGRILVLGDSVILLFAPETVVKSSSAVLQASVNGDVGCAWSADGLGTLFCSTGHQAPNLFKPPTSVVFVTVDSSGAIPSISRISPGQAAYHFLAGYDGEGFVPAYICGPSSIDPLSLSNELVSLINHTNTPAFLINASKGDTIISDTDLLSLIKVAASQNPPEAQRQPSKAAELEAKYSSFITKHFPELPEGYQL